MANIKSQKKRILTNERRRLRKQVDQVVPAHGHPRFRTAAADGDKDKAAELLVSTSRKLDKAASKGVILRARPRTEVRAGPVPAQAVRPSRARRAIRSAAKLAVQRPAANCATERTAFSRT